MKKLITAFIAFVCIFAPVIFAQLPYYPDLFVVTSNNVLTRYHSRNVSEIDSAVHLRGLKKYERVVDIDFRPSNAKLYGITWNHYNTTGRLITINTSTGRTQEVAVLNCPLDPYPYPDITTPRYGIDFDPVTDVLHLVGEDTTQFSINPDTGNCTQGPIMYYNGPSGAGTLPSRAIAFTNNLLPSPQTSLYNMDGVHLTIGNTADYAGFYQISENSFSYGPFDISTYQFGTAQINLPLIVTPSYVNYSFDFDNMLLQVVSLESGLLTTVGYFGPQCGVYSYGLAISPQGYMG